MNAARLYLLGATITLAVMVGRLGWTDRPAILHVAGTITVLLCGIAGVFLVMAIVIGVPALVLILIGNAISRRFPPHPPAGWA